MIDLTTLPIDVLQSWPDYLQEKLEMQAIAETLNTSMKAYYAESDAIYKNLFVTTANESGLERYESFYGIQPRNDSTLDDRRMEILTKMQTRLPYTKRMLNGLLTSLLGADAYTLTISTSAYKVSVIVELKRKNQVNAVAALLRRVIPANMLYDVSVRYNQYYQLSKFTYAELKEYTCTELREDTTIKETYLERGGKLI